MKLVSVRAQTIVRKVPVVAVFFISVFYCATVLVRITQDTTAIFNVAVGITAVLAGLCFGMAASLEKVDKDKNKVAYSGERFFHASISFLVGAILKSAAVKVGGIELLVQNREWIHLFVAIPLHFLALPMFLWAIYDAHTGLTITNKILWKRLTRDKDWDSIV